VLILGSDAVTAAHPATPVQLVHACRRWGFSSIVPASWGDELIATHAIRRCATRDNHPAIHCSCPRVSERLASHAALLESSIFWLLSPPVAVARYLRAMDEGRELHITYAGACPGAADASIDQQITPTELLLSISSRGIDLAAQPTIFEDIIPPDRRRHLSSPGGFPDAQQLWETSAFRAVQAGEGDLAIAIAQLLLTEERLLIDLAPSVGCVCRASGVAAEEQGGVLRAPSAVVIDGKIDIARSAPIPAPAALRTPVTPVAPPTSTNVAAPTTPVRAGVDDAQDSARAPRSSPARPSPPRPSPPPSRPSYRRQSTWRRQSPRPGVVVARGTSAFMQIAAEPSFFRRPESRIVIAAVVLTGSIMLLIGLWIGRRSAVLSTGARETPAPVRSETTALLGRSR
jgi:hypothetical protein